MTVKAEARFAQVPEWLLYADVSAQAIRLYAVLMRHADEGRTAHPGRSRLAELMKVSVDTVDRATKELIEAKALEIRPRWRDGEGTITYEHRPGSDRASNEYLLRLVRPGSRTDAATPGGTDAATPSRKDAAQNESHPEREPSERESTLGQSFTTFWKAYPRRVGKRAARAAFERATKRAPANEIIAGAQRYSDDPNREPKFTAHATTWLNRDGWEDEPLPGGNGKAPGQRSMELARQMRGPG